MNGLKRAGGDEGLEPLEGGDVHAALGDPRGLKPARGANIEGCVVLVDEGLEGGPAGGGGVEGRDELGGAAEVVGLEEVEGLQDVVALRAGVEGRAGAAAHGGEHGDVEGA